MSLTGAARYPARGASPAVLDVRDFGATPSVVGGGDAIQDAIDAMIENPDRIECIYIPAGIWRLTTPLIVKNATTLVRVNMVGGSRIAFPAGGGPLGGARLQLDGDGSDNELELPVMIIQGARGCTFEGIEFAGANSQPLDHQVADLGHLFTRPDIADWISTGIRTNRYSPHCCVAIDPFINGDPGGSATNKYPGLEAHYDTSAYSSNVVFKHCTFTGGYVGTVVTSSGGGANGENFLFDTCYWQGNTYHYSQGQSQSRANELRSPKMASSWCAIDDQEFGPGGNAGIPPMITGAPNIGITRYLFNLGLVAPLYVNNLHLESCASIGKLGTGSNSIQGGAVFTSCLLNFRTAGNSASAVNAEEVPFHAMTWGQCTFDNCYVSADNGGPIRVWNYGTAGRLVVRSCRFLDNDINDRVQVGFQSRGSNLVVEHAQTVNTGIGAVYNSDPIPALVTEVAINGGANVTVMQDATVLSQGTVALASTAGLTVGDIVEIIPGSPTTYEPQVLSTGQFAYTMWGTIGRISAIDPNVSITIEHMPYGFPFGNNVRLRAVAWSNAGGSD